MALQLPATARPVQTQPRATNALPRLRRRPSPRPDRARQHEGCTRFVDLLNHRQNAAAAMIQSSRRHGHLDPRWHAISPSVPIAVRPVGADEDPSIQSWENEGGRHSTSDEIDASPARSRCMSSGYATETSPADPKARRTRRRL